MASNSVDSLSARGFIQCTDRGNVDLFRVLWSPRNPGATRNAITEGHLQSLLENAEVDVDFAGSLTIVPVDKLGKIVNEDSMFHLLKKLRSCSNLSTEEKKGLARKICRLGSTPPYYSFRKVAAALISIGNAEDIPRFVQEGFADQSLPLVKDYRAGRAGQDELQLVRSETRDSCTATDGWTTGKKRNFIKACEKYISPFFTQPDNGVYHYVLHKSTILPFKHYRACDTNQDDGDFGRETPKDGEGGDHVGGFGEVFYVEIYSGHHKFPAHGVESKPGVVAVKRLSTKVPKDFHDEVSALLRFARRSDKQLVKLLATYELRGQGNEVIYHLMFPWAERSVRSLWKKMPKVDRRDPRHLWWIARESAMVADALAFLHIDYAQQLDKGDQERFGRHGDLKAANLLIYPDRSTAKSFGRIFISDFGLSRFHRQHSRSLVYPKSASPSYRPPEFDIPRASLSRKSDIWSLGAFFLEFMTWYLHGWDSVNESFPNARDELDHQNIISDIFFHLESSNGSYIPSVKLQVLKWADRLHEHPDCTDYIHDYLALIMKSMLVADRDDRIEALHVRNKLQDMYESCQSNPDYYTKRCPRRRRTA